MVKDTKFYEILGVSPTASQEELKKAYKREALRCHPDKNTGTEELFKELARAYENLSDPQKRAAYDQYGEAGLEGSASGGMAAEDLFAQFFGGGGLGGMFSGMQNRGPAKARTIHHTHKVTLEDVYRGKISKLALQRSIICPKCKGLGGKEGAVRRCSGCDGHGMKTMMRQMGPMIQRFQTPCPDCSGEGEIIRDKDRCKECAGKKTVVERKVLQLHIDRGVRNGTRVEFKADGDQAPGLEPGDVVFEIEQKPHPRFVRKEDDLIYKCDLELVTALAGGTIFIEHLDERWLSVEIFPGEAIAPDAVKMIRNQGMPSPRHHNSGSMFIHFTVKFPTKNWTTDLAAFDFLRQILPPPTVSNPIPENAVIEQADLEEFDSHKAGFNSALMEEDEDDHPHAERVQTQCATQ